MRCSTTGAFDETGLDDSDTRGANGLLPHSRHIEGQHCTASDSLRHFCIVHTVCYQQTHQRLSSHRWYEVSSQL